MTTQEFHDAQQSTNLSRAASEAADRAKAERVPAALEETATELARIETLLTCLLPMQAALERIAAALEQLAGPPPCPPIDPSKIDWSGQGTDATRRHRQKEDSTDV